MMNKRGIIVQKLISYSSFVTLCEGSHKTLYILCLHHSPRSCYENIIVLHYFSYLLWILYNTFAILSSRSYRNPVNTRRQYLLCPCDAIGRDEGCCGVACHSNKGAI